MSKNKVIKKQEEYVQILQSRISGTHRDRVLRMLFSPRRELLHVATINPEYVMQARGNPSFAEALSKTELTVADGWGVVAAIRILEGKVIDRISGEWLVRRILESSMEEGVSPRLFLLGAREGVAEKAAKEMQRKYPKLQVAWYEGARDVKREAREEIGLTLAKINAFNPDYLLVAYGAPWQDMWIEENRSYLRARVAIGIGGVLDEWAGVVRRCPEWLDQVGFKWLWRLGNEPVRFRRQLRLWQFLTLVLWERVKRLL